MTRAMQSEYMHWAKTQANARFSLATSGIRDVAMSELPIRLEDLEITTTDGYGWPPLLARLSGKLGAPTECLMTAPGTSLSNALALAVALEGGGEALIEHPTYELLVSAARHFGADVRRFRRDPAEGFRLDPEAVGRAVTPKTRLIVITNLHNPSSALAETGALQRVGEIAREAGARVLVDEVYLEALFELKPPSAYSLGPEFVATGSLTKAYGLSGLRCGWILAQPDFVRRAWRLNDLYGASPVHAAERMSAVALDCLERYSRRAEALLEANRPRLNRMLDRHPELELVRPEFGTVVFPRLARGNVEDLADLLRERYETSVVPGRFFGMPDHFRIGIGGGTERVAEGLKRLDAALGELR